MLERDNPLQSLNTLIWELNNNKKKKKKKTNYITNWKTDANKTEWNQLFGWQSEWQYSEARKKKVEQRIEKYVRLGCSLLFHLVSFFFNFALFIIVHKFIINKKGRFLFWIFVAKRGERRNKITIFFCPFCCKNKKKISRKISFAWFD